MKSYKIGSEERSSLQKNDELSSTEIEIPIIINGTKILTNDVGRCIMPHEQHTLAEYHKADKDLASGY